MTLNRALLLILFMWTLSVYSQEMDSVIISGFQFEGLEKTKEWYLIREIRYDLGTKVAYSDLSKAIQFIESDLRKTNLFTKIDVSPKLSFDENTYVLFFIEVHENWYIFPSIIAELADRNFNVWWNDFNHSLKRINLGLAVQHINFRGIGDKISLKYHFGYTRRAEARYFVPALGSKSKIGIGGGVFYTEFKETPVLNEGDKQVFVKDGEKPLFYKREIGLSLRYKRNKFWTIDLRTNHHRNSIDKQLALANPDFFLGGDTKQNYTLVGISLSYFNLDHILRPTRGYKIDWTLRQTGIPGIEKLHITSLSKTIKTSTQLSSRINLESAASLKWTINTKKQPYNLYKGLGYSDTNISGYELYVVDGKDYFYLNNQFRLFLKSYGWKFFRILPSEPILRIKTDIDLALQLNLAYVNDPFYYQGNDLVNRLLYSSGIGLNFTVNDLVEFNAFYSVNHRGDHGLYFHTRKAF